MRSSRHLLQLLGVFVVAIGLTVFLGVHQRSDAVTSLGTLLNYRSSDNVRGPDLRHNRRATG